MTTFNPYDRDRTVETDKDDVLADDHRNDDKLVASNLVPGPRDTDDRVPDDHDRNAETAPVGVAGSASVTSPDAVDEAHRDTAGDLSDAEEVTVDDTVDDPAPSAVDDIDFDERWRDIKAAFVDDPRESVEKADALIDEAVSALAAKRQSLVDQWKNSGTNDTEQLRLALREYRNLFDRLKG
ncbi:hypothetical protein GT755_04945 [Herbidospora sp. NEAU-GS84]|uniref:Uncharacterized protein n=1 Tax=Herbidospora solisilvae TaxID=2696284 RepID=A0A7C9NFG9_9ACTN|nr:hypothetical protein [Herbidospora solisilvae]NAS21032.1 hypothetical protein [Herbidospora solisilvae]